MSHLSISFDLIHNMLGFEVVYRKSRLSRQTANFNCVSFFMQSNLGLKIENWDHCRSCFDTLKLTVASDLAKRPLFKIMFYELRFRTLFFVKNWFLYFRGSILKSEHIHGLISMCRVQFWPQILYLTNK